MEAPDHPSQSGSNSAQQASQQPQKLHASTGCMPSRQAVAPDACNAHSSDDDGAVQDKGIAEGPSARSGQQQALSGCSHDLQASLTPLAVPTHDDDDIPKKCGSPHERVRKALYVTFVLMRSSDSESTSLSVCYAMMHRSGVHSLQYMLIQRLLNTCGLRYNLLATHYVACRRRAPLTRPHSYVSGRVAMRRMHR